MPYCSILMISEIHYSNKLLLLDGYVSLIFEKFLYEFQSFF